MLKKITSKLDTHTLEVLEKSSKTLLLKILGMISGLVVSVFLGRTLGTEGLGVVNFSNKLGMILIVFTMFGFQNVIIKFIAIAKGKDDNLKIASILKTSLWFNGLLAIVIASLGAIILPFILELSPGNDHLEIPLLIVLVMLIPQTFSRVYGSALNGYGKIWQANLVNQTLSIILVALGLLVMWGLNLEFNPVNILLLYAISRVVLLAVVYFIWNRAIGIEISGKMTLKPMLKMAKPLFIVTGTGVIASNADIIILGVWGTFEDVGIYTVAARLALLTSMLLQVSNAALSPKLAILYQQNKIAEMQQMVSRVTFLLLIIASVTLLFFLFFGNESLGLWGVEFQSGFWPLLVLSIGQFFNMISGCSGMLLIMCGNERIHGNISIGGVVLNLVLSITLIPKIGALGAAIATAISVSITNITKVILAKEKTGIITLPFSNK